MNKRCKVRKSLGIFLLVFMAKTSIFAQNQQYLLDLLLHADQEFFEPYLTDENGHEIQLIYGKIDRNGDLPEIVHYSFGLSQDYFYPASSVKLPIAVLALEYINQLGVQDLDVDSRMEHGASRPPQSPAVHDSSAQFNYPSLRNYIRKILLYSDNDAYNRLFELLGQKYINQRLHELGIANTRILHRVGVGGFSPEENRWVNPVSFYNGDQLLYYRGAARSAFSSDFTPIEQMRGKGFYKDGQLIEKPMDFSQKNYLPLPSLLAVLQRVICPEAFPMEQRFDLRPEDYVLLWKAMGQYPKESEFPPLPDMEDGYVKFFLNGGEGARIDEHTRILNKVGFAYGYLTDVAYIVDFENQVEFFVGAVIHVNKNRIFNDDTYEYDEIGLPFIKRVGEVLLEHERAKSKNEKAPLERYHKAIFN